MTDQFREVTASNLESLMLSEGMELVEIDGNVILAVNAPRSFNEGYGAVQLDTQFTSMIGAELGRSNTLYSNYARDEYNPEFRGRQGLVKFDKMRRDAAVRAALKTFKTPINGAVWFIEPGDETKKSKTIAEYIETTFSRYMTYTWPMVLREALSMVDYGYYFFEKVYQMVDFKGKRLLTYQKLAARHPLDVVENGWHFDNNGGPVSVDMYNFPGGNDHINIPISKLVVFPYDAEAGNIRGESILRSAYKHWFFKEQAYKIDAIQKERHGIGIPIIKLPVSYTQQDRDHAIQMGQNLRSNERAFIVLPNGWDILFAKLEGQPVNALETASHHAMMIYHNVLASGILGDQRVGANIDAMMEIFYKASRDLANLICDIANHWIIRDIVDANWSVDYYPKLCVRRLGDTTEARTISFAIRNLVGAGVLRVDDRLEEWSRSLMDAPMFDPNSYRPAPVPQLGGLPGDPSQSIGPPDVGPPRQSTAANSQQGKTYGNGNGGRDGGGTGGGQ